MSRRTSLDIGIQIAGRILNLGLGTVVTIALVRALGAEGYGQWTTLFAVLGLAGYFGNFGLDQVTVRRAAGEPERELEWVGALMTLRTVLGVVVALLSVGVIALLVDDGDVLLAGVLIAATLPLNGPRAIRTLFQLRTRNDLEILGMTVNSLVWGGAVLAIAASDGGIVAVAVAFFGAAVVHTVLAVSLGLRIGRPRFRGSRALWPDLTRVGIPVGIAGVLTIAYASIDQVLVFKLASATEAGYYGAAYRLLEQAHFLPISFMTTLFPVIAAAYPADVARVRGLVQSTAEHLSMASLPILAFAIAAAGPIVDLLFGDEFTRTAPAVPVLMATFVLICFGYLAGNLVVVLNLQKRFVRFALIALVFNVSLNVILIPPFGFMAAAWVTLATEVLVLLLTGRAVLGVIEMRPALGRFGRVTAAAAVMGAVVYSCREAGLPLGVYAAVGVALYPALLLAFGALDRAELAALARRRAPEAL